MLKSIFTFILFSIILLSGTIPFSFSQIQEESQLKTFAPVFAPTVMTEYVKYIIQFQITSGKIIEIIPYCEEGSLVIQIESNGSGELILEIPRSLLDSKFQDGSDDDFFVLLDGKEINYDEIKNESSRKFTIQFDAESIELEIIRTHLISNPESGNISCKIIHNPPYSYLLPPLKQMKNGVSSEDVICKEELSKLYDPMFERVICVESSSVEKLGERGWPSMIPKINPCEDPLLRETSILKCR